MRINPIISNLQHLITLITWYFLYFKTLSNSIWIFCVGINTFNTHAHLCSSFYIFNTKKYSSNIRSVKFLKLRFHSNLGVCLNVCMCNCVFYFIFIFSLCYRLDDFANVWICINLLLRYLCLNAFSNAKYSQYFCKMNPYFLSICAVVYWKFLYLYFYLCMVILTLITHWQKRKKSLHSTQLILNI